MRFGEVCNRNIAWVTRDTTTTVDDLLPQLATQLAELSGLLHRGRQREGATRK